MATLTVQGVQDALIGIAGSPAATPDDFRKELNMALPRLYSMGMWRDLLYEKVITTSSDTFTIPPESEAIINAIVDYDSTSTDFSSPQPVRAQFHDYRLSGRDDDGSTLAIYGIVDDGYSPTIEQPISGHTYKLSLEPATGLGTQTLPQAGSVHVKFSDGTDFSLPDTSVSSTNGGKFDLTTSGGSTPFFSGTTDITTVSEIRVGPTPLTTPIRIVLKDSASGADIMAADNLQFPNEVVRYRRYRVSNPDDNTISIRCLLKRRFKPLLAASDVVHVSSLSAIKHALLGTIAENNADLERSNYHWAVCQQVLDQQLDSHRGAAKPTIFFAADRGNTPNLM